MTTSYLNGIGHNMLGANAFGDGPHNLRVKGATKHYDGFALQDVNLDVPCGSVVGLVGRNGAGKTTLMKIVLGATIPDGGHVELFGKDCSALTDAELAHLRERMGYVGATIAYPAGMTVLDVMRMYELAYPTFDSARCQELCTSMGLDATRRKVSELSRGMGMKLQLACALATGADLLLLDEPTSGLDPIVREEVLDILREWMEDDRHSALISSHITTDLEKIADYLVFIENGQVIMSCERDAIDMMGIAHLRSAELERVLADGLIADRAYVLRHDLSYDMLVTNRAAFLRTYPDYVCDRASIDDIMVLLVKGEVR